MALNKFNHMFSNCGFFNTMISNRFFIIFCSFIQIFFNIHSNLHIRG